MSVPGAWRVRAILSLLLCLFAVGAFAATDPAASAIAWLNGHQNPDGSWGSLSELAARDTARVLIARQAAGSSDVQTTRAAVWLAGQQGITANQFIAEQALAIAGAKMNATGIVSLLALQHAPAGADFGSFSDQTGNTFDSALAIEAFSSDEATYAGTISAILSSLTLRQNADGGWGLDRGFDSNPVWTAEVLIALSRLRVVKPQQSMIAAAQGYLASLVHADGSIGSGPLDTAVSFRALALTGYPLTTANATLAYLGTQQSADGSWSGSAYLTARALEAFASKKPNLVIDPADVTFTPNPVVENVPFTLKFKVRNTGFADSSSSLFPKVTIYDRAIGGPWLGDFTFGTLPPLGISGLITAQLTVSGVSTAHDLVLVADGGSALDEISETDNALTISFPVVARADLQVFQSDIAVSPAHPQPGETAQANVTIRNGGGTATGTFDYIVYDSVDGAAETVLSHGTASLPAAAAQTFTVPFVAAAGTHVLHVVADSASAISESSETNNDAKLSIAINRSSDTDLVLAAGSVTSNVALPPAGTPIHITATVTNAGTAPAQSSVAFFDGVPGLGGTRIGTVPLSVDAASTTPVTFDYVTTPSSGVIYAVADPDGTLPEIDERNNQAFVALTDQAVDLSIDRADILVPKSAVTNGQPVAGRIIIRNRGAVAATGVDVAIYDDLPQNGGIRTVTTSVNVPANGTAVVPFSWPARAGQRFATVVLNAAHAVPELDYTNDRATRAYIANGTTAGVQISLTGASAVDLSELVTDATTLTVTGNVRIGLSTSASCTVSVFEDVDGDHAYDPEVDTLLGSTLLAGDQGFFNVRIPVAATVRFAPAHLMAYLDSTNAMAEPDETNNFVDLYNRSCQSTAQTFAPAVKWRQGIVTYQMPAVARITDTNGDGFIDDYDVPSIVAVTGNSVYAFRGDNGQILWSATSGTTARQINPTIGDVDGDGRPEVLIHADRHRIVCLNGNDGSVKWTSPELEVDPTWSLYLGYGYSGSPLIADLDADHHPEVVVGRSVLNGASGTIKWVGTGGSGRAFPGIFNGVDYYEEKFSDQEAPVAADLNLDGKLEVIAGNTAYRPDGSILWQRTDIPDGMAAMWGRNVALVAHGKVYMLKPDGTNLWSAPVAIPGGAILGGPPTIINVTQGGTGPVLAVVGDGKLSVLSPWDGSLIWTRDVTTNFDRLANSATNGIAGFYSFGSANLAYVSNQALYVFNAWNGTQIYKRDGGTKPYQPGMPAFADVDGDGVGDLITYGTNGLEVLSDATWNSTRSVFNEFSYHETNVSNDSAAIPAPEAASGNYRVATDFGQKAQPVPNFTASYPRVDMHHYPDSADLTVRVGNNGWAATPPSTVTFYRMLPGSPTPVKLDTVPFAAIATGAYRDVSMTLNNPAGADLSFYAVVNEQAPVIAECNTADNKSPLYTAHVSRDIVIDVASPTISDLRPSQNDVVTLAASARYSGAVDGSTPVRAQFFLGDPAVGGTPISPLLDVPMASSYQQYAGGVSYQWIVTSAIGAQSVYVVFDPQNILTESDETNNKGFVRVDIGSSEPHPALSSTLVLNPAAAEAGAPIAIRALLQNVGNVKLENVTVNWTATGAVTGRTFSGSAPLSTLTKNAIAEIALGAFTPPVDDTYTVAVSLSDAAVGLVAPAKSIVIGAFAGVTLTAVPARISTSLPLVQCHARITRTNTIATSDDPLVPLIKSHLQQGITWETRAIAVETSCFKCHVHSFALVNFSTAQRIPGISVDNNVVDSVVKLILAAQNGDGHFGTKAGVVTTSAIGGWALSAAHDVAGVTPAILKAADTLVAKQLGDGSWTQDGVPTDSFNKEQGTTMVAMYTVVAAYERTKDPRYLVSINRAVQWLNTTSYQPDSSRRPYDAARIGIALITAKPWITDPVVAAAARTRLDTIAAFVRAGQNSDGTFSSYPSYQYPVFATAQCLYFLTLYGTPPTDPVIRNGAIWLMNAQQPDGSWVRDDGSITDYRFDVSSWAMMALPAILESYGTFAPDLHLTLPNSTAVVSASPGPTSRNSVAGGTEYVWHIPEPTESGTDVFMNLRMNGITDGVSTPVASAASITYDDPGTKAPIHHDVAIPSVTGFSPVSVRVATDTTAYAANAPVTITETIDNVGTNGSNLTNTLSIVDGNGTNVATLVANESLADLPPVAFPGWHYSSPATLSVPASGPRFVQLSADFGQQLSQLGATGAFDPNSIRVSSDASPAAEFSFTFITGARSDAGTLVVAVPASVTASTLPVHVFYDSVTNGLKPHSAFDLNVTGEGTGFWWSAAKIDEARSHYTHPNELVLLSPQTGAGTIGSVVLPYTASIPNHAAVIYDADLVVGVSGTYSFTGSADYQIWIEIDGAEILAATSQNVTVSKTLAAGTHHVRVTYFKWDNVGSMTATWIAPGRASAPLGGDGFFPTISGVATPLGNGTAFTTNVVTRTWTWNTGLTAAGAYAATATVRQDGGVAGRFDAPFTIGRATSVTASPSTDRVVYDAGDVAHLSAAITYANGNVTLHDLTATVSAISPEGATLVSSATPLGSLTPGQRIDLKLDWPVAAAVAGTYTASVVVKDVAGTTLASQAVPFTVRSSAATGKGLTGTLASPASVAQRSPLLLSAAITNGGNAVLTSAPFRIDVEDAGNQVVATMPFTLDAGIGATSATQLSLDTTTLSPGHFTAFLVSLVSGTPNALANTTFDVTPPPLVSATVATDRASYDLGDTAHVSAAITYASGPGVLTNATATVTVTNGASSSTAFATLAVGATATATLDQPITATMAPGTYTVTVVVRDSIGTTLTEQSSTFTITSTDVSGKGVLGTLTADASVMQGNPLTLTATITNNGNAVLTNASFVVQIGADTLPFTATVAIGATVTQTLTYATASLTPASYTATLSFQQPLATATFTVTPIPIVITATATTDKPAYDLGDTAHITAAITYASGPNALTNATATITVTNGATSTTTFATFAVGATVNAALDQPITATLAPGMYTVTVVVRDSIGTTLTEQSSTFTISSTAVSGKGITGTLAADSSVTQGNPLTLTATITNNGNAALTNAPFVVQIGADTLPFTATVAIGATVTQTLTFATTSLTPASYTATLSFKDSLATTTFTVTPIPIVITATATTDKPAYDLGDTAHITAAITYASGPNALTNATATITVTNGATSTATLTTLAVGATATATLDQPITATLAPGNYTVTVVVRDNIGTTLTEQSTTFTIISTAVSGKGITGTLAADSSVTQGNPLTLTATIMNNGNAVLTNAPFVVQIGADTIPFNATVAIGATVTQTLTYATASLTPASYTATLSFQQPLATATFTVTPIPIVITATATTDKPSYDLGDTAHVTAAITYASGPNALTNATATITVTNGATSTATLTTLAVGATATATLDQPITATLAPGNYTVTVVVRDNIGTTLTEQSTTFTIISTAVSGKGITGTLAADSSVTQGNPLTLTATITNNGNAALTNASFVVQIGADTLPFTATVAIGATVTQTLTYATASLTPASYTATLSFKDSLATTTFTVTPIPIVITATATTDKPAYDLGDTAHITAAITYATGPNALTNATATITVTNGATSSTTFATLAVGATATATLDQPITATMTPGTYTVTVVVRDSIGTTLTEQSSTFAITSTAVSGKGVLGTLTADSSVTQGHPLTLTATITNSGNAALTNAPFVVQIGADTIPFNATVAIGATVTQTLTFATTSLTPASYTATLSFNEPLATTTFTVTPIPVVITATATTDKPSYDLGDTAHVAAAITYASGPNALANATATITVTNGATSTATFTTLAVGTTATATLDQPITATMAPGTYTVTVVVRDSIGTTLTEQSSTFTISSTAVSGKGITGTLAADSSVTQGNPLTLTATITNNGNAALTNAPFVVQIGADTIPFNATVAVGATVAQTLTYATTSLPPASYTATLSFQQPLATATFTVTPIPVVITATATTDKPSYDLGDTAHVTAAITYASGPNALTNATATITVTNGASSTTTFATLPVGATATATLDQPITATMAPGTYTVTVVVRDSIAAILKQQTSTFTINSTAVSGKGVTGTLTADANVTQGTPLTLTATITNNGNAALSNAPFVINIVDPSTQQVVDTLAFTATVAAGSSVVLPLTYPATSTLGVQLYALSLFSRIAAPPVQLASTTFTVKTSAQFTLNVAAGTTPRVVIRTRCAGAGESSPCAPAALPFLTHTLDVARIPFLVVGDDTSFLAALRTGAFSAAIIDQPPANEPKIGDEYLELVRSGFGLLFIDDTPDANPKLAPALQTKFGGKLHGPHQLDLLATPFTAAGLITFNGDSSSLQLAGALAAARITATQTPAITWAMFGAGRVVVLPFDIEQTPTADVAKLVTAATSYVSRVPSTDARQVVPLELDVTTPAGGGPIGIDVRVTIPTGMSVVAASPALTTASPATWSLTASASTTTRLVLWVRLPETAGTFDVTAAVGFSGQLANVTKTTTLTVAADRASIENALLTRIASLQATADAKDAKTLADIRSALDSIRAATSTDAATVAAIIDKLLGMISDLDGLSLDSAAARADAERLLVYWQSRA